MGGVKPACRTLRSERCSQRLEGAGDLYRVRVGEYRIVYRIEDRKLVVLVITPLSRERRRSR